MELKDVKKVKFEVEGYECLRCGNKWVPQKNLGRPPKNCPKCDSPYWFKPVQFPTISKAQKSASRQVKK